MSIRILIVCLGNICRSPTAEAILRGRAATAGLDIVVDSAGTGHWHIGEPPHGDMIRTAAGRGYDLSALRARQVGPEDFGRFDLILAADPQNRADLEAMRPPGATTPVRLLAPYGNGTGESIPDPYMTENFDAAFDLIEEACDGLIAQLQ